MALPSETISSFGEILKAASELMKSGQEAGLKSALVAAGVAWLGPAFGAAASAVMIAKPLAKLMEDRAKVSPSDIGKKALTAAFLRAAVEALDQVGRPDSGTPFDKRTADLRAFASGVSFEYYGTLAGFDPQHPTSHPYYWFAVRTLDDILSGLDYSPRECRLIAIAVEKSFLEIWQDLRAEASITESVGVFEKWAKETPPAFTNTILTHIEYQRWVFREKPLLAKERFPLADVYVKTDSVAARPTEWAFQEDLMGRVEALLGNRTFLDMILIEAPPGYGKSAFSLFASDYLYRRGLLPLRIRVRDLPSVEKQGLWEALESRIAWRPPDESAWSIFRGFKRVTEPFQGGSIFEQAVRWGNADICPYVLILDGWDEVAAGSTEEYRERLRSLLREIRKIFIERNDARMQNAAQVRVILTGRPGDDIFPDEILTRGVRVLRLQPFTQEQLQTFYGKLKNAVRKAPGRAHEISPTDWPSQPRWEQLQKVVDLYDPNDLAKSDSVLGYPLLAHLTLWIYAKRLETDPGSEADTLLSDTTSLYRQLVDLTCEEAGKADFEELNTKTREKHKAAGRELRDLIRRTAAASYCSGDSGPVSYQRLLTYLPRNHFLAQSFASDVNPLSKLLVSYYFTSNHPERGCEFVHKSFVEYLYAEALVEWIKLLPGSGFDPDHGISPDEITLPSGDDAIVWLLRCFSAATLSDEVLKHFVQLIEWEIGRSVQQIPAQRGESEPLKIPSWVTAATVMQTVREEIGRHEFFRPKANGVPPVYHFLAGIVDSENPPALTTVDERVCASWLTTEATLKNELYELAQQPQMHIGDENEKTKLLLTRAGRAGAQLLLRSINFARANLSGIFIEGVDLRGANFEGAHLPQARLMGCNLRRTNFRNANFGRAAITSDFSGASFHCANLRYARLHESNLLDVDFTGADLDHTDISGATVKGANLSGAKNLTQEQVDSAIGDDKTRLPNHLHAPEKWFNGESD